MRRAEQKSRWVVVATEGAETADAEDTAAPHGATSST